MKIESAVLSWYRAEHDRPISNSKFTYAGSNKVVCLLRTDDGAEGVGWVNGNDLVLNILSEMTERVIGLDPIRVEALWDRTFDLKAHGRWGLAMKAMSAIDIACWDIASRTMGRPLYQVLGGARDRVPAYVAGGYYQDGKGLSELGDELQAEVEAGAGAIKMKVGRLAVRDDVARVEAARRSVGESVDLLVDANGGYQRHEALAMARALEDLDAYWFEEPLDCEDIEGSAELRERSTVPLAQGENEYAWQGVQRLLQTQAVDVLNPDAQILGGVTQWMRSAQLALAAGVPVAPHGDQEIHIHLAAAVPNGLIVEYYRHTNRLREAMFVDPLALNDDGTLSPPSGPGLGIELDEDALAQFLMSRVQVGLR